MRQFLAISKIAATINSVLDPNKRPSANTLSALPIFPLPNVVLLPGMLMPLNVFEPRYLALVDYLLEQEEAGEGRWMAIPTLVPSAEPNHSMQPQAEVHPVMGIGEMVEHRALPDGRRLIRVVGVGRVRMLGEGELLNGFRRVQTELLDEPEPTDAHAFAVLRAQVERMVQVFPDGDRRLIEAVLNIEDERIISYALASLIPNIEVSEGMVEHDGKLYLTPQARLQLTCLELESCDERVDLLLSRLAIVMDRLGDRAAAVSTLN